MSRIRGLAPLFFATVFGVANGVAAFGPAFKEQEREKEEAAKKLSELAKQESDAEVNALKKAEAEASSTKATKDAIAPQQSRWSWFSPWESQPSIPEAPIPHEIQANIGEANKGGERP